MTEVVVKRPLKEKIKRYRSIIVLVAALVFNLIESVYFGHLNGAMFNKVPNSLGEYICDDIALVVMAFSVLMGMYDANKFAPQKLFVMKKEDLVDILANNASEAEKSDN